MSTAATRSRPHGSASLWISGRISGEKIRKVESARPEGRADRVLQFVIVKADILVRAVLHPEAAGDGSEQSEAKPFIQVTGVNIVLHNGVELQEPEMELRGLHETVGYPLFTDMLAPTHGIHGIAGICNMAAPTNVVGVENVKPHDPAVRDGDAAAALGGKEGTPAFSVSYTHLTLPTILRV